MCAPESPTKCGGNERVGVIQGLCCNYRDDLDNQGSCFDILGKFSETLVCPTGTFVSGVCHTEQSSQGMSSCGSTSKKPVALTCCNRKYLGFTIIALVIGIF